MHKRIRRWIDTGKLIITDDCWLWEGAKNSDGYAAIAWEGNYNGKGHRIMFSLYNPNIDIEGKVIRHTCDNPLCMRPDHLLVGNPYDNVMDMHKRGRGWTNKVNPDIVRMIRDLWATGKYTQKEIGERFGVNYRTVSYIVNRRTWQWVK